MLPRRAASRLALRSRVVGLAFALGLFAAACGDDSADPAATTTAPTVVVTSTTDADTSSPASATPSSTIAPNPSASVVALSEFAGGLDQPVAFAPRPGSDLVYVVEQYRGVRVIGPDGNLGALVLDLEGQVSTGGEQGVLGIAFSPDGAHLYVDFTDPSGNTHVVEYATEGDDIADSSARDVIVIEQPFSNHNGGDLKFGPDGMLYIAMGDGGAGGDPQGNGQNPDALLGKILRIDPNASGRSAYSVPNDNPFVGGEGADEVWHWGLRNPWRFSFDRATGEMWIGDVGQNAYEEIDRAPAGVGGLNFGWNAREGLHDYDGGEPPDGSVEPVAEFSHGDGNCSITGGFVYRGTAIPELAGSYVFADYCKGDLLALDVRGDTAAVVDLGEQFSEVSSFGEDNDGELYVVSRSGTIWKLVAE